MIIHWFFCKNGSEVRLWQPSCVYFSAQRNAIYPIRAYKWLEAMSVMFSISTALGPHSSTSEEFLHSNILRPKKPLDSWNLVNPLLRMNEAWMNEAWMNECAARLQPLADQYKTPSTPNFRNRKIPRFDRNNPIMS